MNCLFTVGQKIENSTIFYKTLEIFVKFNEVQSRIVKKDTPKFNLK